MKAADVSLAFKAVASARFRRLGREFAWIALGNAAALLGALVGVRVLTELLNPADYGRLALGMTLATLVNQVLMGPLTNGATRFYAPAAENGELESYLTAVRNLALFATGIVVVLLLASSGTLQLIGLAAWISITTAALAFAILSGYNSIFNGIQNAARQRAIVALHQGIEPWTRLLVAVALMIWLGATSEVAMAGYAVGLVFVLGSQYAFLRRIDTGSASSADTERSIRDQIWKFSWPIATFGIFTWAQLVSDRWALQFYTTTRDVGLYSVLFQVGYYPISIISGMVVQLLAPIFYQRAGDAGDVRRNAHVSDMSWRLMKLAIGVTAVVFLMAFLFHAQIFRILVAKEYVSVSSLLCWVVLGGGLFAAGQIIALDLMSKRKTRLMMLAKISTALLGIAYNFAGAYLYGTAGVVIASVLFSVSYLLWMMALSRNDAATNPL